MLIRIVRMTFVPEKVSEFLELFESVRSKIRGFEGCVHLELMKDYDAENIYSTYSIWKDDSYLEGYRHSELFQTVWNQTKILFADKPNAFSLLKDTPFEFEF